MKAKWYICIIGAFLFFMLWNFFGCGYDHKLMEPDCCGGGYILTPFGRLVYGPWDADFVGYNQAVYWEGKEISSVGVDYSPLQKDLVFELLQDGTVQFWFKYDYDSSLTKRTSPDGSSIRGTWKADFRDSSLTIDFGKGSGIPALKGKYKNLGSDLLDFQEISYFDSTYLGDKKRLKRVITIYYNHHG